MHPIDRFRELHSQGCFVMPNPWDVGSARRLHHMGFAALATTSSGHAGSLGKLDQQVSLEQMLSHAEQMAAAVPIPLNVDSERLFAEDASAIRGVVEAIAATGSAGCSIEDYVPTSNAIDPIEVAVARVSATVEAAAGSGMVVTARAEGLLYSLCDLPEIIERLVRFRDAGADVVYAPGLNRAADIELVVKEVGCPVNVLLWPGGPDVAELAALGVRRISTGGGLMRIAYEAMESKAKQLRMADESLEHG